MILLISFAVAVVVSVLLFGLMRMTKDPVRHILISLTDVMLVYCICEHLGFSGVIASVVCGMLFAYMRSRISRQITVLDPEELYDNFWEVADGIFNAVLFVLLGMSVMHAQPSSYFLILLAAGVCLADAKLFGNTQLMTAALLCIISGMFGGMLAPASLSKDKT